MLFSLLTEQPLLLEKTRGQETAWCSHLL